jgi:hypothetical protein
MRLLAGDQILAVVAACTCPITGLILPSRPFYGPSLSHPVRLAGFRLIEAGLPENLDVDCQPSFFMFAVWTLNGLLSG